MNSTPARPVTLVTDRLGARLGTVAAPFAGLVLCVVGTPAMRSGEPVAMAGHPVEEK